MWQRFSLYDIRVIGHYLGVLVLFSTIALLVPLATAIACGEWEPASHYLLTIGITLILGSGLRFLRIEPGRLGRQQALAVISISAAGAVALHPFNRIHNAQLRLDHCRQLAEEAAEMRTLRKPGMHFSFYQAGNDPEHVLHCTAGQRITVTFKLAAVNDQIGIRDAF